MNLLDGYVTKVLSEPEYIDEYASEGVTWWQVTVEYDSYGRLNETNLIFKTREEAEQVKKGYTFLC